MADGDAHQPPSMLYLPGIIYLILSRRLPRALFQVSLAESARRANRDIAKYQQKYWLQIQELSLEVAL